MVNLKSTSSTTKTSIITTTTTTATTTITTTITSNIETIVSSEPTLQGLKKLTNDVSQIAKKMEDFRKSSSDLQKALDTSTQEQDKFSVLQHLKFNEKKTLLRINILQQKLEENQQKIINFLAVILVSVTVSCFYVLIQFWLHSNSPTTFKNKLIDWFLELKTKMKKQESSPIISDSALNQQSV